LLLITTSVTAASSEIDASIERGRYLYQLANCYSCHTDIDNDGEALAGGRALETEFGIFYSPNITPDKTTGIGSWSEQNFIDALTDGTAPDGSHYYPSFPYLSYQSMKRDDILAIKAYLFSQPAITKHNKEHQLKWYLNQFSLKIWNKLNSWISTPITHDSRGSYLVDVLGHCNECHTPRNILGMLNLDQHLTGNKTLSAPDISDNDDGIGDWSENQLTDLFQYGELPDGDYVSDHMAEVVDNSTSKWNDEDLKAAINYLLAE
jgi:mono/diheme cytochrome c family protein